MLLARAAEMRTIDRYAIESCGIPGAALMQNAASALLTALERRFTALDGMPCAVLCGRGNNGGDGFAAALLLYGKKARVSVLLACDPEDVRGDAAFFFSRLSENGIPVLPACSENANEALRGARCVIDALYGTGFHGRLSDKAAELVKAVNASGAFVLSADLPSGAVCDTGEVPGACIRADETVAFALYKPCHFLYPAAGFCGRVTVADIGIPPEALAARPPSLSIITRQDAAALLPRRPADSHKGTFGRLLILCGSEDMPGAALLALSGALRTGVGLAHLCSARSVCAGALCRHPEALFTPLENGWAGGLDEVGRALGRADAALLGCGIGLSEDAAALTEYVLQNAKTPLIVDGDGITHLSRNINRLNGTGRRIIVTPHPAEMARLLCCDTHTVQRDRIGAAVSFAKSAGCTVCLKGAGTVVALPDGRAFVNTTGGSGLAKGGSGDVLAGMIASFAAQGLPPESAARLAVWLHGEAGDRLSERLSSYGALPSELPYEACSVLREMEKEVIL